MVYFYTLPLYSTHIIHSFFENSILLQTTRFQMCLLNIYFSLQQINDTTVNVNVELNRSYHKGVYLTPWKVIRTSWW